MQKAIEANEARLLQSVLSDSESITPQALYGGIPVIIKTTLFRGEIVAVLIGQGGLLLTTISLPQAIYDVDHEETQNRWELRDIQAKDHLINSRVLQAL